MKKIYTLFISVLMIFSLTACNAANEKSVNSNGNSTDTSTDNISQTSSSSSSTTENSSDTSYSASETEQPQQSSSAPQSSDSFEQVPEPETTKVLVAYFSATNTTGGVAQKIAESLNADIYEITPENPYTDADLNYHDDKSRSTVEMNDPNSRPAISGSVENMDQYNIVFIGYPIWWGEAPRILSTFVESYDLSGKTVVPFCTSGGSGVGSSASNLEKLTSGATWLSGTRLNGSASRSDVVDWINGLGLDITAE
ncbi:MAG: flavodoxin [Oscillospiraceae bacterium]|nr:flavodoxin [Oscillospiraceae bacterium]